MKADESRSAMPARHKLDHAVPTVIHHPEEDMPLLARWLDRAMQNQTRFWGLIAAIVLVTVALSVLGSGLTLGRAASDEAWTKLENAKSPGDRVEIAREFPKTAAERWALLQAASEYYNEGFKELPAHRDAALPNLKKALDLFQRVADESEPNSPQARAAALGVARTLEARNDLTKAIAQYEKIAHNKVWAGTDEARDAERFARLLKSPEAQAFYKELYAYTPPPPVSIPSGGGVDIPFPPGHPPVNIPGMPAGMIPGLGRPTELPDASHTVEPNPLTVPPPPPSSEPSGSSGLPDNVFAPVGKAASPPK